MMSKNIVGWFSGECQKVLACVTACFDGEAIGFLEGRVVGVSGLSIFIEGLDDFTGIGDHVRIFRLDGREVEAALVGFRDGQAVAMAYNALEGVGAGCRVVFPLYELTGGRAGQCERAGEMLRVNASWQGRVVDPMGRPVDGKGDFLPGGKAYPLQGGSPDAVERARLGRRLDLGVTVFNLFATMCEGQRLGLFAGSGVGKSTLMGMLARNTECDVAVIALVGERGREVREFIEDDLGVQGLTKSIIVVATSDSSPLMRRDAAYTAMTIAESFRDEGKSVLFLMDSVTRFCHALREIGLSCGELPATRGYPPSVFAELPRLLERAGPGYERKGQKAGQITALFSVLVEGDDHNEPVADAVRGILDGHVVMERRIAEKGRYPAVSVLKSLSRLALRGQTSHERALVRKARSCFSIMEEMEDMIRLGAYQSGTDSRVDEALRLVPQIEDLISQEPETKTEFEESFSALEKILNSEKVNHA